MNITVEEAIDLANTVVWGYILIPLLLGTGAYFTIRSGFLQVRHFGHLVAVMKRSFRSERGGISSFGAFATGLAARVGTGNIVGVALALKLGGPGAVFWMWLVALVGMSTSFFENTLAQLFKVRDAGGTFRGGPAYYMERGLGQRWMGLLFSFFLIIAFAFVFNAVQANSMTDGLHTAFDFPPLLSGMAIAMVAAFVIFGGIRRIARFAEFVVPFMAIGYLAVALFVIMKNLGEIPGVLLLVVQSALGVAPAAGGAAGYAVSKAIMQGVQRGLFSNEAGLGSSPNAAATAEVKHPAVQGFVQMLGVFTDTIIICTCTASIILLSEVPETGSDDTGMQLTTAALCGEVGGWGSSFLAISLLFFAFTSLVANYYFGETSLLFLFPRRILLAPFRAMVLGFVLWGSVAKDDIVWNSANLSMGLMALLNLVAILLLSPLALRVLKDYLQQLRQGREPQFDRKTFPDLEGRVGEDVW